MTFIFYNEIVLQVSLGCCLGDRGKTYYFNHFHGVWKRILGKLGRYAGFNFDESNPPPYLNFSQIWWHCPMIMHTSDHALHLPSLLRSCCSVLGMLLPCKKMKKFEPEEALISVHLSNALRSVKTSKTLHQTKRHISFKKAADLSWH